MTLVSSLWAAPWALGMSPTIGAAATPSCSVNVAYGHQLQDYSQNNNWVVWVEGNDACPNRQVLVPVVFGALENGPCDSEFTFNNCACHFEDCGPWWVLTPGRLVCEGITLPCQDTKLEKIHCHGGEHDIIKHGKCIS
ncbi:hypothetical protein ACCO45_009881 [Purpureocillium lilacinum]|uniref:Uncharacterized protein n=1 Tax=Purpureocillium lilacinum TaxID=33203 RepID=A0ACC4DJ27_PURLI